MWSKKVGLSVHEDLFFLFWRSPKFGQKNRLNFGKDLFFLFGDHLNLDRKTVSISAKTFFLFGDHLNLDRKNVSILAKTFFLFFFGRNHLNLAGKTTSISVKTNQNLGQDRVILCLASKRPPPPIHIPGYATVAT